MGCGSFSSSSYASYCKLNGRTYDDKTDRAIGQFYTSRKLNEAMNPNGVVRECVNTEEHPNTVPVILALDVTGSMGSACRETAQALAKIVKTLYNRYADVEIMVMGVGDFECDSAPLQVGQYESDVRIASDLDNVYMEMGGGGNAYESYTAPWYFGLHHTKLDCYDKQGRRGIIITMGDEPINPYLKKSDIQRVIGDTVQEHVYTDKLYEDASKKFDIYHIAVDDVHNAYRRYKDAISESFGQILGQNFVVSTINNLSDTICECVSKSIDASESVEVLNEDSQDVIITEDGISW